MNIPPDNSIPRPYDGGPGQDNWPLVGRNQELSRLTNAVIAGRGAVITGPPGAGKTTLAMTCLQTAEGRGMSLARVSATRASRQLPFGALAPLLPPDPSGDRLGREDHAEMLRRYGRAIVEGARGRPLVVFVDDAHLLDDGSAILMHQLALTRAATVLVTVRLRETAPDPVVALWKDGLAERVEVDALDDATIEDLLVTVLDGPVDAASVRQLAERCGGNPLFLRELVTGALETGALTGDGGLWHLRSALRPTSRLVELVALRLGDLSAPEQAVLELVALGEPLGQAELAGLTDPASVETLERKALITSVVDGRRVQVRLAHPIYGDVVRAGISALRERAISRSLAEVIEAVGARRREDSLLVASLRLAGGGGSAGLLLAGAVAARARHDYPLTERLARAAVDEGGGFEARFLAAESAHFRGRPGQAEAELTSLSHQAETDAERARIALLRFDNAYFLRGRADFRLIEGVADAVADPFWRDELLARRLFVMCISSGPRATVEAASTFLQRPAAGSLTVGHIGVAHSLARLGRFDEATQLVGHSLGRQAIPAADDPWEEWNVFGVRTYALVYAGRLSEAEELLTRAYGQVVDQPTAEGRAYLAGQLAFLHLEQGRVRSAFRHASELCTVFRQLGRTLHARWGYIAAAQALALAGHADRAAETLAALDALGLPPVLLDEAEYIQARAWTLAAAGDTGAARQQLERAADLGQEVGDLVGAASALHGLARLGRARQAAARLADLAAQFDGDLVACRAAYASAVAAGDNEVLVKVSGCFEEMGVLLYAAEASAEAAVLLRRAGRPREAGAVEQKAARLLARCEGAATPSVRTLTARARLTPAELDVAVQAAAGHSNQQIADGMHLSVRTVGNHLQRAYEKLGISGRQELASALQDQPGAPPPSS